VSLLRGILITESSDALSDFIPLKNPLDAGEKQVMTMRIATRAIALVTIPVFTFSSIPIADAAGRTTSSIVNTILNGKGAPKSSLGLDGDFYIDTRSLLLYGPKRKGKWPTPINIQGPTGPSGSDGKNGSDGKAASTANISSVTGPQGIQGEKGDKGETGLPGASGTPGAMGPAGPAGASGPAGAPGANGSNGGQGPAGATGAQGPAGAKGETGTVGPSEVSVIDIPETILGTSVGYTFAASETFGALKANSSYSFEMFIRGSSNILGLVLGVDVLAAGGILQFSSARSDFRNTNYSTAPATYGFVIKGTIQVAGADSSFIVRIIDAYGDSGASPITFTGKAYITLVGSIK